jgi:exodeoxyribonuclease V beta subunit
VTAFAEFDPKDPIGRGRTVIEASAGTGKTFTISAIVARLIAEEGIPLEDILVVTFTRAATAELRARVRERLVETRRALTNPPQNPDSHLGVILGWDPNTKQKAAIRIDTAVSHFDRAQIFTIHGFAQRLLGRLGLRARLSPDVEPGTVDDLLLTETAGDLLIGRYADRPDQTALKRDVIADIGKVVVEKPDARIVPGPDGLDDTARARVEFAHLMRTELQRRLRLTGSATFDDGLAEVRDTLADPQVGSAARALLQRSYAVALVDESQDTDPTQWQVIRSMFDNSRLVVIGDPKQSIYSFRGADVESYLSALAGAGDLRTLTTNWRSDGPLIDALDVLLAGAEFGESRITYHKIKAAEGHEEARIERIDASLVIRRFGDVPLRTRRDGFFYVNDARQTVAADVAARIVELLSSGVTIEQEGTPVPLRPDHIAVLCRTNKQVEMVRAELGRRSVPSVAARTGGVFTSAAAEQWRRLLLAVEQPDRVSLVRMAATGLLVGKTLDEVAAMTEIEALDLQQQFRRWSEILHGDGVPALFGELHRSTRLAGRVLSRPDGERIMTDLAHIAEEMHAVWRRRRTGSLAGWLSATAEEEQRRAKQNVEEPESRQRRLETDAAAVQVQTIHVAKGLEWPVVFVPYAWDIPSIEPAFPVLHDPDAPADGSARPRLVNVAGKDSPGFDEHVTLAQEEEAAEEGRLLYVALTRARHHLAVWWVENAHSTAGSKLHELITAGGRTPEQLVAASEGKISTPVLTDLPGEFAYQPPAGEAVALERARFERPLDYAWRRASFTSLSPEHPLMAAAETADVPLRTDETGLDDEEQSPPVAGAELPMADLPRGARFGTLVHHMFEAVPFDALDPEAAVREALEVELQYGGWEFDPEMLVAGMVGTLTTPLGPDPGAPRLCDLDPGRVFNELTFELPVRTEAGTVSLNDIGAVLLEHLPAGDPYRSYAHTLQDSGASDFRGFLTGAIDLTTVLPGDRYTVIDYKSNSLPARDEVPGSRDYGPGPLTAAMIDGNYVLQATLYQVALHRYLQWRLAGYDPEQHLGGAMYLFVRGMTGPDTPVLDGERAGVARWHPPAAMIVALSDLFAGIQR